MGDINVAGVQLSQVMRASTQDLPSAAHRRSLTQPFSPMSSCAATTYLPCGSTLAGIHVWPASYALCQGVWASTKQAAQLQGRCARVLVTVRQRCGFKEADYELHTEYLGDSSCATVLAA